MSGFIVRPPAAPAVEASQSCPLTPDDIIWAALVRLPRTGEVKIIQWTFKQAKSKCRGVRAADNYVCLRWEAPILCVCACVVTNTGAE